MSADSPKKGAHRLADHLQGEDSFHVHGEGEGLDHDHDHDHFGPDEDLEANPIWAQDHVTLTSVGIDIGSSGTQVIFSRLQMRRLGEDLTSRYFVVGRETLYQSPVALTPYLSEQRIDEQAIGAIVDQAYSRAGLHADAIDTGAVILTGEALRRENAKAIADVLAEVCGEFVCATAGHHMEAMLAAYGSGAAEASHARGERLLNVDIGGGTTKLGLLENGRVLRTAAVHIGGRLVVADAQGRITRLDPRGRDLAARAGLHWELGAQASAADFDRVAEWMADALVAALTQRPAPAEVANLFLTEPIGALDGVRGVMFSGGVAEYVYGREARDFGDLGRRLGGALRARIDAGRLPWPLLPAGECIRATAYGASEYSVQLSGNTLYVSDPSTLLPRRNLQVLQPPCELGGRIDPAALARAVAGHFAAFDLVEGEADVALAFRWRGEPSYERIAAFAQGIAAALRGTLAARRPLYLILDGDIAQTLGAVLREEQHVASEMLVIDGVALRDFDYVDLGRIRMPSYTVPVTVKSLLFGADPRAPHRHAHGGHDHDHGHDHAHEHAHGDGHGHARPHGHARNPRHPHDAVTAELPCKR